MAFRFFNFSFLSLFLRLCVFAVILVPFYQAQTIAPGGPGKDAQWATAGKQGIGTSATLESKVWFTLAQGVMTEVYYPDVTVANVHLLQFVVVNPRTKKVETEQDDAIHQVKVTRPDSLTFQQINKAKSGEWTITKTYTTDPERDVVLIDVQFQTKNKGLNLYVYYDPSIGNSGMHDKAYSPLLQLKGSYESEKTDITENGVKTLTKQGSATVSSGIGAEDGNKASAVYFTSDIEEYTNVYYQANDVWEQLKKFGKIKETYAQATDGNVIQMARIMKPTRFTTIFAFGEDIFKASANAAKSLEKGFPKIQAEYEKGWSDFVKTLPKVEPKYQAQFNMAAMQLRINEDKTVRGANIASLTVPWGGGANANENNIGGYHLVWSRDLYQVATAYMALGDKAAAIRALNFLFEVQQKPDGSFPQNSYLDGKPFWESLQLDEVAFPLIMAHEFGVHDKETYEKHVKKSADFIAKTGPITPQERWEEEGGYSPSTIAAEIAGLVCAAEIAKKNGDIESADRWLKTADEWAANIERWTVTKTGKYSKDPYYLRITQGNPDSGNKLELNNGAGFFDERDIVDAGFLELVRLGIKSPNDPIIQNSLKVIDQVIKVNTPNGEGFYRYNNDGYGEMDDGRRWNWDGKYTGKGRLWALLSGERGQYELALHDSTKGMNSVVDGLNWHDRAKGRLDSMLAFANDGLMIPEQIWDKVETPRNVDKQFAPELKFGEGTGSATPLAWSMAQFIRLAVNLKEGRNLDTPKVVYDRYVGKQSSVSQQPTVKIDECSYALSFVHKDGFILSTASRDETNYPVIWQGKRPDSSVMRFAYFGAASDVEIVGDFTSWKPCGLKLSSRNEGKKYIGLKFPNAARIEYKLIVDGKWINDPLNPNKADNGVGGENSYLTMPDYKATTWDEEDKLNVEPTDPTQVIDVIVPPIFQEVTVESATFGKRVVKIYLPMEYELRDKASPFPVLYFQDGSEYINRAKAAQIQRNLVKAGKIKPFIMVFLDPKDRMKEYWASDEYAKFVATEVVPAIDKRFKTVNTRDGRAIIGASLGGVTSLWVGLKYPDTFARLGAQSSSFWIDNGRVVKELEKLDPATAKFRFYLDDGTLEGVDDTRRVNVMLRSKGYQVKYVEGETGHNWTSWRDRLADAFIDLWQ